MSTIQFLLRIACWGCLASNAGLPSEVCAAEPPHQVAEVRSSTCLDCHDSSANEGGLDLETLAFDLSDKNSFATWVKVHDRVKAGEMPPADYGELDRDSRTAFLSALATSLRAANIDQQQSGGRVVLRRLNRSEYEYTLRDLLHLPDLQVAEILPSDASAHGFDNVGDALTVSSVQIGRYLDAAEHVIDAAMHVGPRPELQKWHIKAKDDFGVARSVRGNRRQGVQIGDAIGLLRQGPVAQPWNFREFNPQTPGRYAVRVKIFGFSEGKKGAIESAQKSHVVSFYARQRVSKRWLGSFDVPTSPEHARVVEFSGWINPGEQIEVFLATMEGRDARGDGIAIEWIEAEGPLYKSWPPASHRELFGDLPVEPWTADSGYLAPPTVVEMRGQSNKNKNDDNTAPKRYMVVSEQPLADAGHLLRRFIQRAFRRPVADSEVDRYRDLVRYELDSRASFDSAMRVAYQAVLCSPDFLFLQERPGTLNDHALAARLSYFLWSSLPDDELRTLAAEDRLGDARILREQVERMLTDPRSDRFVENFAGQWLRLRDLTETDPDDQLYPEYDELLLESMRSETLAYFHEMLDQDLGIDHVVDSDFAMLNRRLAQLYGIPDVEGVDIRRVSLPADSVRGGLLTQASILKVSANGTSTSPVTRGAWITERVLGRHVPPPPSNVSGIEPDLLGTTTIREQLSKHREVDSCAACHRIIDPPGFALECFDVIGGYRDRYRSIENGDEPAADPDLKIKYKLGLPVDASGETVDGHAFDNVESYRMALLSDRERLARNLTEKLLTYATGGGIEFADREIIDKILRHAEKSGYGLRTLVHEVVQSKTFRMK